MNLPITLIQFVFERIIKKLNQTFNNNLSKTRFHSNLKIKNR